MGICCLRKAKRAEANILVLGLSGSGKTEILRALASKKRENNLPTPDSRIFTQKLGKFTAVFIEIGGNVDTRMIWSEYYKKAHAIIYVYDISNESTIDESHAILKDIISHNHVKGKSVLVMGNKTDHCTRADIFDIHHRFPWSLFANTNKTLILLQTCGRDNYQELFEGINWLQYRIESEYEQLQDRIQRDVELENRERQPYLDASPYLADQRQRCIANTNPSVSLSDEDENDTELIALETIPKPME